MFISHENKCVNMDNMDLIEVTYRETYKSYVIQMKRKGRVELCICSSGHMTEDEAKVVYGTILAAMNGTYFDSRKKEFIYRPEKVVNVIGINKEEVDSIIKAYHEEREKDSQ